MTMRGRKMRADLIRGWSLVKKMMFMDGNMMIVDSRTRKDNRDGSITMTETIRRPSREERRLINMAFIDAVNKSEWDHRKHHKG
jgi:hypothetical protein